MRVFCSEKKNKEGSSPRIAKIIDQVVQNQEKTKKEIINLQKTDHAHAKDLILGASGRQFIVMKKHPGISLDLLIKIKLLPKDSKKIQEMLYKLSRALKQKNKYVYVL